MTGRDAPGGILPRPGSPRVVVLLVGLGLLLTASPAPAAPAGSGGERAALDLLEEAALASAAVTYAGTKYVAAWRAAGTTSALVDVRHDAGRGLVVSSSPTASGGAAPDELVVAATRLDRALLQVLAERYELRVVGEGRCTGRVAHVVEARDDGVVRGRFWVDVGTGLLLRREVYDGEGRRVRSSAFVDLVVDEADGGPSVAAASTVRPPAADAGDVVAAAELEELRDAGWHVPADLPGGFVLFDARRRAHGDGDVLHLAYSDGLSTTSLFVQEGGVGGRPPEGFARRQVGGHAVWARSDGPERVVWGGGGRAWTVVSDAPDDAVQAAVGALPHDPVPRGGVRARLSRGLSRLGSWLNPFD